MDERQDVSRLCPAVAGATEWQGGRERAEGRRRRGEENGRVESNEGIAAHAYVLKHFAKLVAH
jgi:hypothetical protein